MEINIFKNEYILLTCWALKHPKDKLKLDKKSHPNKVFGQDFLLVFYYVLIF